MWVPNYTKKFSSCQGGKRPCPALWSSASQIHAHFPYLSLPLRSPSYQKEYKHLGCPDHKGWLNIEVWRLLRKQMLSKPFSGLIVCSNNAQHCPKKRVQRSSHGCKSLGGLPWGPPSCPGAPGPSRVFHSWLSTTDQHCSPHSNLEQSQRSLLSKERQEATIRMRLSAGPTVGLSFSPQHCSQHLLPAREAHSSSTGSSLAQKRLALCFIKATEKSFFQQAASLKTC